MKSRYDCLCELIKGIFGVKHVRDTKIHKNGCLNEDGDIIFDKGLVDQCTFTGNYEERIRKIMFLTFLRTDTQYRKMENGVIFNRSIALRNAIKYFNENGVDLTNRPISENDEEIVARFLFNAINDYILPAIFQDNDKIKDKNDDIESKYTDAMELAKLRSFIVFANYQTASAPVQLTDDEFDEEKYNYAIPFEYTEFGTLYRFMWTTPTIYFNSFSPSPKYETIDELYQKIVEGYMEYPFKSEKKFANTQKLRAQLSENSSDFPQSEEVVISNERVVYPTIIENYYFLTYFDKDFLNSKYPEVHIPADLDEIFRKKAIEILRKNMVYNLQVYYVTVMRSIEDILMRIFSLDLEAIATHKTDNLDGCKKMFKILNFTEQQIELFFSEKNGNFEELAQVSYYFIESTLHSFFCQIEESEILIQEYKTFLEKFEIQKHTEKVENILASSKKFKNLLFPKKNIVLYEENFWEIYQKMTNFDYQQHRIDFQYMLDVLKKYCTLLKD